MYFMGLDPGTALLPDQCRKEQLSAESFLGPGEAAKV
jgi:hypothetical protein